MMLSLKTETLLWLLPVVFMIHDLEEIIMMKPWMNKHWLEIEKKFPKKIIDKMETHRRLSVSAFALVVAEEFILITVFTFIAVQYQLYNFWAGLLIGFFIHLLVHIAQFLAFRKYVPFIFTAIPAAIFSIIALHDLSILTKLDTKMVIVWSVAFVLIIFFNLSFTIKLSLKFDLWLKRNFY